MTFDSENLLVDVLCRELSNRIADPDREFVFREVTSPHGIADVVFCRFRKDWKKHTNMSRVNPLWAYTLHHLPLKLPFNPGDLAERTGSSLSTVRSMISNFVDAEYVERVPGKDTFYRKVREPGRVVLHLAAYEAKLRDWRKALYQAQRYKDYANEAHVALSVDYLLPALKHAEQFSSRNVGLLAVESAGLSTIYPAIKGNPRFEFRRWYITCQLAKLAVKTLT